MNILMLDKSAITDRRIVLEAESLIQQGHQVILCAGRSSPQQNDLDVDKHLKIYRFFTNSLLEYCLNQSTTDELKNLSQVLGQYKNQSASRLSAYLKFAFHHPEWALIQMNWINTPIPASIHQSIQFLLSLYSLKGCLILESLKDSPLYWLKQIEQKIIPIFKPDV
ncbi:MAG TPA: hypothetical protein DCZ80_02785, partial [Legionellales bacterium]|nr:hypothetical protein [Legionellales bacterium]